MVDKMINILKSNLNVPLILLSNYKKLKINEKELIILIYLMNQKSSVFNPQKISEDLNIEISEVLESIEVLSNADLITINTLKDNGLLEERIDLSNLYNKLAYLNINEEDTKEETTNIYDSFENEFARTLSPIEYELIKSWLDNDYSEELILCALKEAVYNGVKNLRYIDKILYEWNNKGIKTKEDVLKDKQNFKKNNTKKEEMFDYDWLNEK